MDTIKYLDREAILKPRDTGFGYSMMCYYSRTDGSYICHKDMLDKPIIEMLVENDLTDIQSHNEPNSVVSIGFSKAKNMWVGWSHRASAGFTIGSKVSKGDCAYNARNADEFLEQVRAFWDDDCHEVTLASHSEKDGVRGVLVEWIYNSGTPNESLHGTKSDVFTPYPKSWGRGEWEAMTLDDAKQMACDFAESVG